MFRLLLLSLITLALSTCGGGSKYPVPDDVRDAMNQPRPSINGVSISRKTIQTTPKGVKVFSKAGLTDAQLQAIDSGMEQTFAEVRSTLSAEIKPRILDPTIWEIYIPPNPCRPSPVNKTPSFLVRGDVYDGTVYDQYNPEGTGVKDGIGVVFAAELMFSHGNIPIGIPTPDNISTTPQGYLCPDMSVLSTGARFFAEHVVLANGSTQRVVDYYYATMVHLTGGHPLIPIPDYVSLGRIVRFEGKEETVVAEVTR